MGTRAEALYNQGLSLFNGASYEGAIEKFKASVRLDPTKGHTWYHLGFALIRSRKGEDAVQAIDRAIALDRKNPLYWFAKTTVYSFMRDRKNALKSSIS